MKPGWKSTEFWMALVGMLAGGYIAINGQAEVGSIMIATATGAYNLSRGLAKRGNGA